ncbi:MAG: hypothetical protein H0X03_07775, partial [Nitrosopumilus sp.]|nr:hypothetical protein [Nitrosopumilus sp.]
CNDCSARYSKEYYDFQYAINDYCVWCKENDVPYYNEVEDMTGEEIQEYHEELKVWLMNNNTD